MRYISTDPDFGLDDEQDAKPPVYASTDPDFGLSPEKPKATEYASTDPNFGLTPSPVASKAATPVDVRSLPIQPMASHERVNPLLKTPITAAPPAQVAAATPPPVEDPNEILARKLNPFAKNSPPISMTDVEMMNPGLTIGRTQIAPGLEQIGQGLDRIREIAQDKFSQVTQGTLPKTDRIHPGVPTAIGAPPSGALVRREPQGVSRRPSLSKAAGDVLEGALVAGQTPGLMLGAITNPIGTVDAIVKGMALSKIVEEVGPKVGADPDFTRFASLAGGLAAGAGNVVDTVKGFREGLKTPITPKASPARPVPVTEPLATPDQIATKPTVAPVDEVRPAAPRVEAPAPSQGASGIDEINLRLSKPAVEPSAQTAPPAPVAVEPPVKPPTPTPVQAVEPPVPPAVDVTAPPVEATPAVDPVPARVTQPSLAEQLDAKIAELSAARPQPPITRRAAYAESMTAPAESLGRPPITRRATQDSSPTREPAVSTSEVQSEASVLGSPTRRLYDSPDTGQTPVRRYNGGRPISEQESLNNVRRIWKIDRPGGGHADMPMRAGKITALSGKRDVRGLYLTESGLTRLREAADLPTFMHELGHDISAKWFERYGRPKGSFAGELEPLGRNTSKPSYPKDQLLEEGVAEFFRTYFPNPAEVRKKAPTFASAVEKIMRDEPDFGRRIRQTVDEAQRYASQPDLVRAKAQTAITPIGAKATYRTIRDEMRATAGFDKPMVERFADAVGVTGKVPSVLRDPHKAGWEAIRLWFDKDAPAVRAMRDVAKSGKGDLNAAERALLYARQTSRSDAIAEKMLDDKVRDVDGTILGPGLLDALAEVPQYLEYRRDQPNLPSVLHAMRAIEIHNDGTGRNPGLSRAQADGVLDELQAHPDGKKLVAAAKIVHSHEKAMREWMFRNGALPADLKATLDLNEAYVPLQRVMDSIEAIASGQSTASTMPFRKAHGSPRVAINPLESIVRNQRAVTKWTLDNQAVGEIAKVIAETPDMGHLLVEVPAQTIATVFNIEQIGDVLRKNLADQGYELPKDVDLDIEAKLFMPATYKIGDKNIVTYLDGGPNGTGKRRFFQVQDESLFRWMQDFGPQTTKDALTWAKAIPKAMARTLSAAATQNPIFAVKNGIRDTIAAVLQSKYGFTPVYDHARALKSMVTKDADYMAFKGPGGGEFSTLGGHQQRAAAKWLKNKTHPSLAAKAGRAAKAGWVGPGNVIETLPRLAEYKLAMENGGIERGVGLVGMAQRFRDFQQRRNGAPQVMPPARPGWTTKDLRLKAAQDAQEVTLPFREGGVVGKAINQYVPFTNAALLGFRQAAAGATRSPIGTALTLGAAMATAFLRVNKNEKDDIYRNRRPNERRDYATIPQGFDEEHDLTIPMLNGPQGMILQLAPAYFESMRETADEPTKKKMSKLASEYGYLATSFLGPAGVLLAEQASNYDFYRGRAIVSPYDNGKEPDLQVKPYTSSTARLLGYASGVSPLRVEQLGFGLGSNTYRAATKVLEPAAGKALELATGKTQPARPADDWSQGTLAVLTGFSNFVRPRVYSSSSHAVSDFYDAFNEIEKIKTSTRAYQKGAGLTDAGTYEAESLKTFSPAVEAQILGDQKAAVAGMSAENRKVFVNNVYRANLARGKKDLDGLRDMLHAVEGSTTLTPEDKRTYVNEIFRAMTEVAQVALGRRSTPVTPVAPLKNGGKPPITGGQR